VLDKIVTSPPRLKAFSYNYSQTAASVKDISSYAKSKGDQIDLVKQTIPLGLLIIGFVSLAVGLVLWFIDRRREHPAEPTQPASPREPQPVR
jgi:hypothetical protein